MKAVQKLTLSQSLQACLAVVARALVKEITCGTRPVAGHKYSQGLQKMDFVVTREKMADPTSVSWAKVTSLRRRNP